MVTLKVFSVILLSIIFPLVVTEVTRFDNYQVYHLDLNSWEDVDFVRSLKEQDYSFDILSPIVRKESQDVDVLVPPNGALNFTRLLDAKSISYILVEKNFQDVIDREPRISNLRASPEGYGWDQYYRLDDIYAWMMSLETQYSGIVSTIIVGKSYEDRDILGIKISHGPNNPSVFIEGGMHAREWISPATSTFFANELLTSENPETQRLAQSYDWYIFPNTNPDGYEYSATDNRLWRKTRKPCGPFCVGTDGNRNWDFHWRESGASIYPCSEVYAGKSPFSESEVSSLSTFISSISNLKLYISLHSYSQLLLYPFGTRTDNVENTEDFNKISQATVDAIAQRFGTTYNYGNIRDTIYPASGSSIDWVYAVGKVPLTFAFELRPDMESEYGFMLPPEQIIPTGEETFDGITAMIQEAENLGYMS